MIRHAKAVVVVSVLLSTLALLGASLALALQTHTKGEDLESLPNGAFAFQGLAVDQSGGEIYAVDQFDPNTFAHGVLHRFEADGSYDEAFATATASFSETLSQPMDVAVDNTGGGSDGRVYVANSANNRIEAIDGSGAAVAGFGTAGQINGAEDSPGDLDTVPAGGFSFPCGVAVDQTNANLFVSDQNNNRIWIFDSSGAYLGKVADSTLNGPCGIAFTSSGDLYVRNANDGKVIRFARKGATEYEFGAVFYVPGDNGTPADSSDDLAPATDVAVDSASDHVYVDKGDRITEYDSGGSPVSTFGQGEIGGSSAGIAIDPSAFTLYASAGNRIASFGPLVTLPDVTTGDTTNVTDIVATATGTLDPLGIETTECFFEWGEAGLLSHTAPCTEGDAFDAPQEVSAEIVFADLAVSGACSYRLVVANAQGTSRGQVEGCLPLEPPRTFVTDVGTTTASIHAELDPRGMAGSYHFEYVDDVGFQANGYADALKAPVPDADAPPSHSRIAVEQTLRGLEANTPYHYRVVAHFGGSPYIGKDRAFRTDAIAPAPAFSEIPGKGFLPDGRAWEMVSPPDKNGSYINAFGPKTIVAPNGNRIAYMTPGAFGDAEGTGVIGNAQYLATRGPGGWTSHAVTPRTDASHGQALFGVTFVQFSPLLTRAVVTTYDLPQVSGDIDEGLTSLYREEVAGPPNLEPLIKANKSSFPAIFEVFLYNWLVGGDQNFDRIFISSAQPLASGVSPLTRNIYEWDEGTVRVAGVLPNGKNPPEGSETAIPGGNTPDSVSADGSRLLFLASMAAPPSC